MNIIVTIILMYIIISFLEWYIHKYLMHYTDNKLVNIFNYGFKKLYSIIHSFNQDKSHEDHHIIVNNDGYVNMKDDGMFMSINNTPLIGIFGFLIYYLISKALKFKHNKNEYKIIFIIFLIISCIYYLLWNILHPSYHNYNGSKNDLIKNNFIYEYLEKYHMIHHFNKGKDKCNYNIILPGADFLFGTYKGCVDNIDFCKNNISKTEKEIELCEKEINNIKLRTNIDYCNK